MARPRLPVHNPARESERLSFADMHRTGSLAWQEFTYGHGPEIAHALNCGHDQVEKMGRPACAHRPPNLQLAYAMWRGLEIGLDEDRVLGPLRWLNEAFRQLCYTAPELGGMREACINLVLAHTMKELGEYTHLAASLVESGKLANPDIPRLKRELDEALRSLLEAQKALEEAAKGQALAGAKTVQFGDRQREDGGTR